jgi:hypothetical protein
MTERPKTITQARNERAVKAKRERTKSRLEEARRDA